MNSKVTTTNQLLTGPPVDLKEIHHGKPRYRFPLLFKVIPETAKEIKPGEVAVVVSNVGRDPSEEVRREMAEKVRQRMEREEKEQAEESAARLDMMDESRTVDEIKLDLMMGDPAEPVPRAIEHAGVEWGQSDPLM